MKNFLGTRVRFRKKQLESEIRTMFVYNEKKKRVKSRFFFERVIKKARF